MTALKNDLQVLHPTGKVGEILTANEKNWIHPLLNDNPGLFSGFADRDDPAIFKNHVAWRIPRQTAHRYRPDLSSAQRS